MATLPGILRDRLAPALMPGHGTDRLADLLAEGRIGTVVPDVTDRAWWDGVEPGTRAGLLAEADAELVVPLVVPPASDWARTFRDGVRTAYEDIAGRLRERAARLVVAATLTGEVADADAAPGTVAYLDAAADALLALAEFSTWCWAPHDSFTAERGEVVPDPDDPYLDLGAAEVASLFAWADHVLGPHLDIRVPGLRRRLRREVDRRVLTPFESRRDWRWIGADGTAHNWNPWIHGGVLAGALLLGDDASRRASLVRLIVEGLDHYLAVLPDDGGIDEGVAYWWQGACRLMECLDLLAAAGGDTLDARDLPVLAALSRFPHRMHLGDDWYVNAGDAPARLSGDQPWHVLFAAAERHGDHRVRAHALARGREGLAVRPAAGLGRALAGLADARWRAALAEAADTGGWLEHQVWLPGVQVLVARERPASTTGLAVAAKAGHNGERHNHLDVGSYWVALDGRPLVVDVGQPTYTAASFGPDRYRAWPVTSDWHNVPAPGAAQRPGAHHAARGVRVELGGSDAALHCDLTAAYPAGLLTSWHRVVRLAGDAGQVVVTDRWTGAAPNIALHHVLAGDVELDDEGALVRADGRSLRLSWDPAGVTAVLDRRRLDDRLLRRSWGAVLTRLTLRVTAETGNATLAVRMERAR